jgi:hypothetical protein
MALAKTSADATNRTAAHTVPAAALRQTQILRICSRQVPGAEGEYLGGNFH